MSDKRDFFTDGFMRLTQLSALNDPLEATYCEQGLNDLIRNFDDVIITDSKSELNYKNYINLNKQNLGIISLSESKDNLLMWAHYANEHNGFLVGLHYNGNFKFTETIFDNLYTPKHLNVTSMFHDSFYTGVIEKVIYRKSYRYNNDRFDYDYSNISVEGPERILYEIFLGKSDEWIYEKEHRVILRLEQADRVLISHLNFIREKDDIDRYINTGIISCNEIAGLNSINLYKINDDYERSYLAKELAFYSKDPTVIFQMKIRKNAIFQCILGIKSPYTLNDILNDFGDYIDLYKAKLSSSHYQLDFDELYTRY